MAGRESEAWHWERKLRPGRVSGTPKDHKRVAGRKGWGEWNTKKSMRGHRGVGETL